MKKLLSILISAILLISLCGCAKRAENPNPETSSDVSGGSSQTVSDDPVNPSSSGTEKKTPEEKCEEIEALLNANEFVG